MEKDHTLLLEQYIITFLSLNRYILNSKDGNKLPLSYTIDVVKSVLGKELCQYIETLNDSESTGYSFGEIAEKIKNEFH
jgi:hypothetical protein